MIETIVTTLKNFEWTGLMGILLYWVPLTMCAVGYTVRTFSNISKDVKNRQALEDYIDKAPSGSPSEVGLYLMNGPYYRPTDTLGALMCRVLATVIPIVNLWCALTDVAVIKKVFTLIASIFDKPLVPKRK